MDKDGKSEIDELNERLNSRTQYTDPEHHHQGLGSSNSPEVEDKWSSQNLDEMLKSEREQPNAHPLVKRVFLVAVGFFLITVVAAGFVFFGGANFVSSKNVDISITGPTSSSAGEVLDLGVVVVNRNNADLDSANLTIQYPAGTRDPGDANNPLNYVREDLGEIRAGREISKNIGAILFGAQGEVKEIKFTIEYKVKGSNAIFYKDKIFEIVIGEVPLTLKVSSPSSVNSGEPFTTTITVDSRSQEVIKGVMVRAEYPYGFTVQSSSPSAIATDNVWSLGDLAVGEKKTITLKGTLLGENQEERTFRFYAGVSDAGSINPNFQTIITSTLDTVSIARPAITLNTAFNGDTSSTYIAPAGESVSASVRFQNNLPEKLLNPRLEVKFSGSALNKDSVRAQNNGFYDSGNNTIVWSPVNLAGQNELSAGEEGRVTFNLASLVDLGTSASAREIVVSVSLTGVPQGASGQRSVTVTDKHTVRIASQVNLSASTIHSSGPFINTGPMPPKAETETAYTVVWNIGNTQNDIESARVTARLGPNVSWGGSYTEQSEGIGYDAGSNLVTWEIGELSSGTGFSSQERQVYFQVLLTPSTSQIGTAPTLVDNISFTGVDKNTSTLVSLTSPRLTTRLTSDSTFVQGDDIVVE